MRVHEICLTLYYLWVFFKELFLILYMDIYIHFKNAVNAAKESKNYLMLLLIIDTGEQYIVFMDLTQQYV